MGGILDQTSMGRGYLLEESLYAQGRGMLVETTQSVFMSCERLAERARKVVIWGMWR